MQRDLQQNVQQNADESERLCSNEAQKTRRAFKAWQKLLIGGVSTVLVGSGIFLGAANASVANAASGVDQVESLQAPTAITASKQPSYKVIQQIIPVQGQLYKRGAYSGGVIFDVSPADKKRNAMVTTSGRAIAGNYKIFHVPLDRNEKYPARKSFGFLIMNRSTKKIYRYRLTFTTAEPCTKIESGRVICQQMSYQVQPLGLLRK